MDLRSFHPAKSPREVARRLGRGTGSGWGRTSGRGHKGQKARSGGTVSPGFEGGQMPMSRRLPKWGFTNVLRREYAVCNVSDLNTFKSGQTVDIATLADAGLFHNKKRPLKILGDGELSVALTVKAHRFTATAEAKIKAAGGTVEKLS